MAITSITHKEAQGRIFPDRKEAMGGNGLVDHVTALKTALASKAAFPNYIYPKVKLHSVVFDKEAPAPLTSTLLVSDAGRPTDEPLQTICLAIATPQRGSISLWMF
jgi:hypothetical protein